MRLAAESGLWATGAAPAPGPLAAVLEGSGAVLSWIVDAPVGEPPVITFTDHRRADWLWRVIGEAGHVALAEALQYRDPAEPVEVPGVSMLPGSADSLRRLAFGHWLRRWWPASVRDAITALDPAVLDAELAVLTVGAEDFFADDTFDSDVTGLLAPHLATLDSLAREGDPRITELVDKCRNIADDIGLPWTVTVGTPARRDDYALAAAGGTGAAADRSAIAAGVASVSWSAVPPGVFDAAEHTVDWTVRAGADAVDAVVQAALSGLDQAAGIAATLRCGSWHGSGVFDAAGRATLPILDADGTPLLKAQAWNTDWSAAELTVGAGAGEPAEIRARVRALARARLAEPSDDAFLAELLAAESDY